MKTATLGNPAIMQKPYTRFYIYFIDIAQMEEVLETNGIPFFAMEMKVSQTNWILPIPDKHRKEFDDLVVANKFHLAPMNHSFWYQDRERDAMRMGGISKTAIVSLVVVFLVLLVVIVMLFF